MTNESCWTAGACRYAVPFVAGALVTAAALLAAAAPQQSGAQGVNKDSSFAGPPKDTQPGSDSEFRGPPPTGGQGGQAPTGMGYNNPGGMVDPAALQAAAAGGIHYHVHYHGTPGQSGQAPMAGYAPTTFVNPASMPAGGDAGQYMPGYGPGNPGPLGSEAGLDTNPAVGSHTYTGFTAYGAAGNYFGGPGGYFGGPGGYFGGGGGVAPSAMAANAAYSSAGYVGGFND